MRVVTGDRAAGALTITLTFQNSIDSSSVNTLPILAKLHENLLATF